MELSLVRETEHARVDGLVAASGLPLDDIERSGRRQARLFRVGFDEVVDAFDVRADSPCSPIWPIHPCRSTVLI